MAASIGDLITDVRNGTRPNSTTVITARTVGGTNLACSSLTGWPTASKVHFVTYQIDTNNNPISNTQLDCYGIVSGSTITSIVIVDGTDGGNSIGDVVEMLPTAAWAQDLATGLTISLNRDGTLVSNVVTTAKINDSAVTTAKINDLGVTTGKINNLAVTNGKLAGSITSDKIIGQDKSVLTTDYNPYKFSAYRNAAWTSALNASGKVTFDSEVFDNNSNFDTTLGRYTAPVSGFYWIYANISTETISGAGIFASLYVNGIQVRNGGSAVPVSYTGGFATTCIVESLIFLNASDYVEAWFYGANHTGAVGLSQTRFEGFLVSRT